MRHLIISSSDSTYPAGTGGISAEERTTAMRRLLSLTAFGFGFYYLWYNTDTTTELLGLGAMGVALLLEFIGAD